jgi:hypothetical protein
MRSSAIFVFVFAGAWLLACGTTSSNPTGGPGSGGVGGEGSTASSVAPSAAQTGSGGQPETSAGGTGGDGYPATVCAGVVCDDQSINYDPFCKQPGDPCSTCHLELTCSPDSCKGMDGYCRQCGGGSVCIGRCNAASPCVLGETCLEDGSCVPTPCVDDGDCPENHECIESPSGASCARRNCLDDADCAGPCLEGVCYEVQPSCFTCY